MQSAYGITTLSIAVAGTGASAPVFAQVTMSPYSIRTTVTNCAGGTGFVYGAGITTTVGYPGISLGALVNNNTGLLIDGPAGFWVAGLGTTLVFSIVRELSPGFP